MARMTPAQEADAIRLRAEHEAIKAYRTAEEPIWRRIIDLAYPDGTPPDQSASDQVGAVRTEIFDNTAEDAGETAAGAFLAMTTNPATRWMELGLFDRVYERDTYAGHWLWDTTSRMLRCFRHPTTLFNLAVDEDNVQYIHLGNSCLHVEDKPGRLPLYRACDMAHIWWDENADGVIDTVHREFELSARAAYDKWGKDNLPDQIVTAAESNANQFTLFKFLHINKPRTERDRSRGDRSNMAFRSIYLAHGVPHIVEDGGSHELEYICSRMRRRAGRRYGRGCGHKALGDIDVLQRMTRTTLLAGERTIDGPMMAPDDEDMGPVSLKNRSITRVPAALMANGAYPRPLLTNTRVDIGLDLIIDRRELVRRSYMKQLIELSRDPKYTATQFISLEAESKRGLVPVLMRHENERLGPLVTRTFNILARMRGVIPPAPDEMRGQPLQASFDSPDAKAMRLGTARAISQSWEVLSPLIKEMGDPALWDNFDIDEGLRSQADGLGVPAAVLRPIEVRDRLREQRQQVVAEQDQREGFKDFTTGVKNMAPMAAVISGLMQNSGGAAASPAAVAA